MAVTPYKLFQITQEECEKVQKFYDIDEKKIQECLDAIDEWCKKQEHLAEAYKYMNRNMLERLFLLAKGSLEGTKIKIEKLLTTKGIMSDIMLNWSYKEFNKFFQHVIYMPLPKHNYKDQTRVLVTQIFDEDWEATNLLSLIRYAFMVNEFRFNHDYVIGDSFIWDLGNLTSACLTKINPMLFKKAEILSSEVFGTKVKGVHLINAPNFIDKILSMVKPLLKEKIARRIHIHKSLDDLHKEIPKVILPKDFGGDEPTLAELYENWKLYLQTEEATKIIDNANKVFSDETKRNSVKFNEEYLGMPGSFRKLTVD